MVCEEPVGTRLFALRVVVGVVASVAMCLLPLLVVVVVVVGTMAVVLMPGAKLVGKHLFPTSPAISVLN
jgi:hypothetical protein